MELQTALRRKAKIKMGLQGPSGVGKTKSSLLIAYGLCHNWEKIAVIDTENNSAHLYADLGPYKVLQVSPPFAPERFIEAIDLCVHSEIEVIIIDSISHEWDGTGGILDIHGAMLGNSFTNWSKVTPRHNAFIQSMLQSNVHVIATIRSKQEYVLSEKNGKQVPEKVGLKGITKEGFEFDLTLLLELDVTLKARATKDRTQLFYGKPEFIPSKQTGEIILQWCNEGKEPHPVISKEDVFLAIEACGTIEELQGLYYLYPMYHKELTPEFSKRKNQILTNQQKEQSAYDSHSASIS